jgi:hypothetical protein
VFPQAPKDALRARYEAALTALSDDQEDGGQSRERGIAWGTEVAETILSWRATDGFNVPYPAFVGGEAIGQWRPIFPATAMSAQQLAFTQTFVVANNTQFQPRRRAALPAQPTQRISTR